MSDQIPEAMGGKLVMSGAYCVPKGDNMYDLMPFGEEYKTIAQQIIEEDLKDPRPWALRGGIKFAQMEVNDDAAQEDEEGTPA